MFDDSRNLIPDKIEKITTLCQRFQNKYLVHKSLNITFAVVMIIGLICAVFMYKENKKEYDEIENQKRRKSYYMMMRRKKLRNVDEERKV